MHQYQKPNLVDTYIEVNSNAKFLREMEEAAGDDGVYLTKTSRALPLEDDDAGFGKSKYFMGFTGRIEEDGDTGKPNAAQQDVLQAWDAKVYPDKESWDISQKVATNIADGVEPEAASDLPQVVRLVLD